jgi:predicted Zn-dependent protease
MNKRFLFVLAILIAATVAASLHPNDSDVSLASVRQLWSDVLRDADQPGLRLTRLSAAQEMQLGRDLLQTKPWPDDPDPAAAARVARVAQSMLPHVHRQDIQYEFHVARAPMMNAFALPGGQILVTSPMLEFVQSDSELAEVLGHEIAHVDLRHAVEHYQYQYRLGTLVELFHRLVTMPYSADQELDADAEGLRLAVAAGYNPADAPALFARMQQRLAEPPPQRAATPGGEILHSLGDAVVSYFRTHPPSEERARRLRELAAAAASRRPAP